MTEDFDKEAERERLREKYERDKKKREATEQMSELLLQGATMTNAHCSACGDPIFRYDGQEFCPTCEKPVDRGTGEETSGDEEEGDDSEQIEVTTPSDDARVAFGEGEDGGEAANAADEATPEGQQEPSRQQTSEAPTPNATDPQAPETPSPSADDAQTPEAPRQPAPQGSETRPRAGERQPARGPPQGSTAATGAGGADAEAAREALVETLTRFSRKAAATEDPNRASEHLAAAREAAEALAALRQ